MLERQPRVLTEIYALHNYFEIILFGEQSKLSFPFFHLNYYTFQPQVNFHLKWPVPLKKITSAFVLLYLKFHTMRKAWALNRQKKKNSELLLGQRPDLVIMHGTPHADWVSDVTSQHNIPLIINMHEYYPLEFEDNTIWMKDVKPVYDRLIKNYFSKANAYFVVCNTIIKKYESEFGFRNQILVRNAKPYYNIEPSFNREKEIRMIHHGVCNRSRRLELTIDCMKYLPEHYSLDLLLVKDEQYYPELVQYARHEKRIRFIPTVPTEEIIPLINAYDLGLFLLPPLNFNYLNALPNKLFEFIQARLAIVVSPNPEMKTLVEDHKMGIVSKDYSAAEFARAILSLSSDDINTLKQNTHKAAAVINDEEEQKKILQEVKRLLCVE